jgi:hypothetical protein
VSTHSKNRPSNPNAPESEPDPEGSSLSGQRTPDAGQGYTVPSPSLPKPADERLGKVLVLKGKPTGARDNEPYVKLDWTTTKGGQSTDNARVRRAGGRGEYGASGPSWDSKGPPPVTEPRISQKGSSLSVLAQFLRCLTDWEPHFPRDCRCGAPEIAQDALYGVRVTSGSTEGD